MQKIKASLLFIASIGLNYLSAQEVHSKPYGLMLNTLLSHSVPEIDVDSAKQMQDVIFVDSREKEEYEVSHIRNAIWVGYENLKLKNLKEVDKSKTIIVYCSVGYRSEKVAEKLLKQGFEKVYNLYGGIFEWKNQGNTVYKTEKMETEKVHAYDKKWGIWLKKGEKVY